MKSRLRTFPTKWHLNQWRSFGNTFFPLQLWSHFFSDFRNTIPVESFYQEDWVTNVALQPKQTYKAYSLCIYMYKTTHIPASIPQCYVTVYRAKLGYKEILRDYYFCHICTLLTNFKYKFYDRISYISYFFALWLDRN